MPRAQRARHAPARAPHTPKTADRRTRLAVIVFSDGATRRGTWSGLCVRMDARSPGGDREDEEVMKYGLAWLIGVPPVLIAAWFLLNHC